MYSIIERGGEGHWTRVILGFKNHHARAKEFIGHNSSMVDKKETPTRVDLQPKGESRVIKSQLATEFQKGEV